MSECQRTLIHWLMRTIANTRNRRNGWTLCLGLLACLCSFCIAEPLDEYGGKLSVEGEATGDWHVESIDGRFWLVTPKGNGFFALGVNHYGDFNAKERAETISNLRAWGFNTGGHSSPDWLRAKMPHFISVTQHDNEHWEPVGGFRFDDVFDPVWQDQAREQVAKAARQHRDSPLAIGISLTDTPRYNLEATRAHRVFSWVDYIRALEPPAPGFKAYVDFLKRRWTGNLTGLVQAYRLPGLDSFDQLDDYSFSGLEISRPAIREDDEAFLAVIADAVYTTAREAIDAEAPGMLLLSERFKMHDHPDGVLQVAARFCDIIAIQAGPTYGPDVGNGPDESVLDAAYWDHLYKVTGRPILVCDHACSFYTEEYPRTLWHQFPSPRAAGQFYREYLLGLTEFPFILGYQRCQYRSRFDPIRNLLKQGLLDLDGKPYAELVQEIAPANKAALEAVAP